MRFYGLNLFYSSLIYVRVIFPGNDLNFLFLNLFETCCLWFALFYYLFCLPWQSCPQYFFSWAVPNKSRKYPRSLPRPRSVQSPSTPPERHFLRGVGCWRLESLVCPFELVEFFASTFRLVVRLKNNEVNILSQNIVDFFF